MLKTISKKIHQRLLEISIETASSLQLTSEGLKPGTSEAATMLSIRELVTQLGLATPIILLKSRQRLPSWMMNLPARQMLQEGSKGRRRIKKR